jgi:hypothetical protein
VRIKAGAVVALTVLFLLPVGVVVYRLAYRAGENDLAVFIRGRAIGMDMSRGGVDLGEGYYIPPVVYSKPWTREERAAWETRNGRKLL